MRAALFDSRSNAPRGWVSIEDLPQPKPQIGEVLVKVLCCGVCRPDPHIVEGDLLPCLLRVGKGLPTLRSELRI